MGWEGGGGLYWSKEALHQASGVGDRIEQEGVQKQDVAKGVCRGLRHWMVTERMRGGGGGGRKRACTRPHWVSAAKCCTVALVVQLPRHHVQRLAAGIKWCWLVLCARMVFTMCISGLNSGRGSEDPPRGGGHWHGRCGCLYGSPFGVHILSPRLHTHAGAGPSLSRVCIRKPLVETLEGLCSLGMTGTGGQESARGCVGRLGLRAASCMAWVGAALPSEAYMHTYKCCVALGGLCSPSLRGAGGCSWVVGW
jgi:hypothetical protein